MRVLIAILLVLTTMACDHPAPQAPTLAADIPSTADARGEFRYAFYVYGVDDRSGATVTVTAPDASVVSGVTDSAGRVVLLIAMDTNKTELVVHVEKAGYCSIEDTVVPHSGPSWNWFPLIAGCD